MTVHLKPPPGRPSSFRATVHGTLFGGRDRFLDDLREGDSLVLLADPDWTDDPQVWVHVASGDPVGHLPPEIGIWLGPWMGRGGSARATILRVHGKTVPSWRRLVVGVALGANADPPTL